MSLVTQIPLNIEYGKHSNLTPQDIQQLRDWVDAQPHLPGKYLTELDLILTYHCCECSMEVAKQVLDLHFTLRTSESYAYFFRDRAYDKKVQQSLHTILYALLPPIAAQGYRVVYMRLLDDDYRNYVFNDILRTFVMLLDLWQYEEGTWPGFVILVDMDQVTVAHLSRLEVMTLKKLFYFLQECVLTKLKGIHFLNAPHFMDRLMMLIKPFLKKTLMDMVLIHNIGSDTLSKYVPKEAFPKEDGGLYKDHETIKRETILRLQDNHQFFELENKKRVNEALRPGGKVDIHDALGIQGSFKKLDID